MSPETKDKIVKRGKSLLWRMGCMAAVGALNELSKQLIGLGLPIWVVTALGGLLGEATKWLNNHTELFGAKQK